MLGAAVAALAIPAGVSASTITQVMHGLDNAKGLAFGPEGALYVAEAGRGGPASGLCWTSPRADLGFRCYGAAGGISRYWHGTQGRIVNGLPALEDPAVAGAAACHRCRRQVAARRSRRRLDLDSDHIPEGDRRVRPGRPGSDGSGARP